MTVIGQRWAPRSHEFRDLLQRSGLPFAFHTPDSVEGRALLEQVQRPAGPFPVFVRFDGVVFTNPTNEEAAAALGARHSDEAGVSILSWWALARLGCLSARTGRSIPTVSTVWGRSPDSGE